MCKEKKVIQFNVLEADTSRLGGSICLVSGEGLMVDDFKMVGLCTKEISWQDRKPEGFKGQVSSLKTTCCHEK